MKIGIPKEIKNNENRVGMTPAGVAEFIRHGHEVMVQHTAGENSGLLMKRMKGRSYNLTRHSECIS